MAKGKQRAVVPGKTGKAEILKPLSSGGTSMEVVLREFLKVDPQKVEERLEKDGIINKSHRK